MLIENVLGFEISIPENRVTWYVNRTDEHGVRNMAIGDNDHFDAVAEARGDGDGQLAIRTRSTKDFKLVVRAAGAEPTEVQVRKGEHRIKVELRASPR